MVLLSKEQAGVLEPFAVECIRVLEDLANTVHADLLGEDLFDTALEARECKSVS